MSRRAFWLLGLFVVLPCVRTLAAHPEASSASGPPDPAAVERYGPAYRYPKAGWIVLHVEGKPYERGYQHGRLLAPEIADYLSTLATKRNAAAPPNVWREVRTMVNALFLRRYDPEYLEEMKGIADGAAAGGARFDNRPLDLLDIVAINSDIELEFLDAALHATANGLEGRRFPNPAETTARPPGAEHCSAFVATGPATADGKVVVGHITMFNIVFTRHFNIWLDIKPSQGHRVLMQSYPGGIQSGLDYYMNDAGLIVTETTIAQTKFNIEGQALASRIRRALQYSRSIDEAVAILKTSNNGMYTNEWLLADTNTNEIAMFELGTDKSRLWRSSKGEWFGGTEGFYWGCNNAKDLAVRLETVASVEGKPANLVFHPSDRDRAWRRLYHQNKGKIGEAFGFEAYGLAPLAAAPSCDAKFTTAAMAKELKTWALFGPPLGRTWEPGEYDRNRCPSVQPLVSNDWTILTVDAPPELAASPALARASEVKVQGDKAEADLVERLKRLEARAAQIRRVVRSDSDPAFKSVDNQLKLARRELEFHRASLRLVSGKSSADPLLRTPAAVDLSTSTPRKPEENELARLPESLTPAWRGTILPGQDADLWLSAAFADYEPIVTRERALQDRLHGRAVSSLDREQLELALFGVHTKYATAVRRWGKHLALTSLRSDLDQDDWYGIASGKGVLFLAALRARLGDEAFLKLMDDFGRAHAGHAATTDEFRQAVAALPGRPVDEAFLGRWLKETGLPESRFSGTWSIDSFLVEPEKALIVYGTLKEASPQREAAERLQHHIERLWSNILVPIRTDREVSADQLKSHHILLIGRPETNAVAAKYLAQAVPVKFGPSSFVVAGETYAHPDSAVIAAGDNPLDPRYELVVFAGLGTRATRNCVQKLALHAPAEALLLPSNATPRRLVLSGRENGANHHSPARPVGRSE